MDAAYYLGSTWKFSQCKNKRKHETGMLTNWETRKASIRDRLETIFKTILMEATHKIKIFNGLEDFDLKRRPFGDQFSNFLHKKFPRSQL